VADVDERFAEYATLAMAHLNDGHGDELVLIARANSERDDIVDATVVSLDRCRLSMALTTRHGTVPLDVDFERPIADLAEMRTTSIALVRAARIKLGIDELTAAERDDLELRAVRTHVTEVVRVEQETAHFRRITFGGDDLSAFGALGPDQYVYLLVPPAGCDRLAIDRSFSWDDHERIPAAQRPVGAYYTVREWRPDDAEIDVLVLDHHGEGVASAWSRRARPGDPAALWGPRTAWNPPAGTDHYLLVADETGLPAVAAILEQRPSDVRATVVVELGDAADHVALPADGAVDVTWLYRGDEAAGTTSLLTDAVRALPWPDGTVYAWGGAESRSVTAVRTFVRGERGLGRDAVSMTGYWRHPSDTSVSTDDD
jgi:NADPH-dependent ferric siderophore reductase